MPELELKTAQRAVTAAGTPEQIKETPEDVENKAVIINIRAKRDNTGNIYITRQRDRDSASTSGDILAAGESIEYNMTKLGNFIGEYWVDLAKLWIDAANDGDEISYSAVLVSKL